MFQVITVDTTTRIQSALAQKVIFEPITEQNQIWVFLVMQIILQETTGYYW